MENDKKLLLKMILDKLDGSEDYSWSEIADINNLEMHPDTLRKAAVGLKWADEAGIIYMDFDKEKQAMEEKVRTAQSVYNDSEKERISAEIARIQMRDERTAMNAFMRAQARECRDRAYMMEQMGRIGESRYVSVKEVAREDNDYSNVFNEKDSHTIIATFADSHFGLSFEGFGGAAYNTDIAKQRVRAYAHNIYLEAQRTGCNEVHLVVLGDLISGMIHKTVQIANRENVADQVMIAGETMADFIFDLSETFDKVSVTHVPGNHSRMDKKEDSLNGDRLDKVVMWYAQGTLKHIDNIYWHSCGDTISEFEIDGKKYIAVHGDYDNFSEAGVARLVSYVGYKPEAIFTAHRHTPAMIRFNDTYMIQSGSFVGSGDEYTERGRLGGGANQILCTVGTCGIGSIRIVNLM